MHPQFRAAPAALLLAAALMAAPGQALADDATPVNETRQTAGNSASTSNPPVSGMMCEPEHIARRMNGIDREFRKDNKTIQTN